MSEGPSRTRARRDTASQWDAFFDRGQTARKRFEDDARDQADFDAIAAHRAATEDPLRPGAGVSRPSIENAFFAPAAKFAAPLVSVVDDTLPYALFQRGSNKTSSAFVALSRKPPAWRFSAE